MKSRNRRLYALETCAPARPRPSEEERRALAHLAELGLNREWLSVATAADFDALLTAALEAVAKRIRESGATLDEYEAAARAEGARVSESILRRLSALIEPEGVACGVCGSRDHVAGVRYRPHVLPDGSAPTWPYEAATVAAIGLK